MNQKERQKALFCVLSDKAKNNALIVVKDIQLKEIKTKDMHTVMQSLPVGKTSLLTLHERNETIEKSSANLPTLKTLHLSYLNIADMLKYETLILSEAGVEELNAKVV